MADYEMAQDPDTGGFYVWVNRTFCVSHDELVQGMSLPLDDHDCDHVDHHGYYFSCKAERAQWVADLCAMAEDVLVEIDSL